MTLLLTVVPSSHYTPTRSCTSLTPVITDRGGWDYPQGDARPSPLDKGGIKMLTTFFIEHGYYPVIVVAYVVGHVIGWFHGKAKP